MSAQVNGPAVRQQHRAEQAAAKPLDSKIRCLFAHFLCFTPPPDTNCIVSAVSPLLYWWPCVRYSHLEEGGRTDSSGGPIILSCAALTNDERIHDDVDTCHRGSRQSAQRQRRAPSELRLHAREKSAAGARISSYRLRSILILQTRSLPCPDHMSAHLLPLRWVKFHRDTRSHRCRRDQT